MRMRKLAPALALLVLCGCGGQTGGAVGQESEKAAPHAVVKSSVGPGDPAYATVVEQLYVAYFGRPADAQGLANFESQLAAAGAPTQIGQMSQAYKNNPAVTALIDSFGTSAESIALYGSGTTSDFVTTIFKNVINRAPAQSGLDFWVNAIDSGNLTRGDAALSIMAGALTNTTPQGLQDATLVDNRIAVATLFSAGADTPQTLTGYVGSAAAATVRNLLSSVTAATNPATFQSLATTELQSIARYSVGGTVIGLNSGTSITLSDNQGNKVSVDTDGGAFDFSYYLTDGASYDVTVGTLPDGETCTVTGGSGKTGLTTPIDIIVSCTTIHVYITSFYNNTVHQYAIGIGGNLQALPLAPVSTGGYPNAITTDPAHKYAFVTDTYGNSVEEFTFGADNNLDFQRAVSTAAGQYPGPVTVDPSGSHLYFPAVTYVYQYDLGSDGSFTALDGGQVATPEFPIGLVMTPDGKFAYTANLDARIVSQCQVGADGGLVPLSEATFPMAGAYGVFMHPSGKFIYVINIYDNSIRQFSVGTSGNLTPLTTASVPAGGAPNSMAFSPDGLHAYVVNGDTSGTIGQFSVGTNGSLTPLATPLVSVGTEPLVMAIDPTNRYAYVGYVGGTSVSQFLIGGDGSLTPAAVPSATTGSGPRGILIH